MFYAFVDMGFAEEAYCFAGDVSEGVVKLSYAAKSQPLLDSSGSIAMVEDTP